MSRKKNRRQITSGGLFHQPTGGNTILLTQATRWNRDIANYQRAVTEAERVDFPNRVRLYDLYDTILLDTHLGSVLDKRKSAVLSSQIEFKRDGKPDGRIGEMLESPWFLDFLDDLLDTVWWGHSLFQFHPDEGGWMTYQLIPRKHVDPILRQIRRLQSDIAGVSWEEFDGLLAVGKPRDIGQLIRDIPWVLYKRGDVADWAQFAELFGQPIREYTYDVGDDDARYNLVKDIFDGGGSSVFLHPVGSNLTLHEAGNKTGSSDLYKGLASFCNTELSKHVLGNTLTTEAGEKGTQALGTVQQKAEERLLEQDKRFVLNVLNYQMTDLFESFGINVKGGRFSFVSPKNTNPAVRVDMLVKLKQLGLPLDHDQLYEEFGLNKPKDYAEQLRINNEKLKIESGKEENQHSTLNSQLSTKKRPSFANLLTRFFGEAPESNEGAALEW